MTPEQYDLIHKHRHPCPSCKKKGLGFSGHPHARGCRLTDRFYCRYCKKAFRLKDSK